MTCRAAQAYMPGAVSGQLPPGAVAQFHAAGAVSGQFHAGGVDICRDEPVEVPDIPVGVLFADDNATPLFADDNATYLLADV